MQKRGHEANSLTNDFTDSLVPGREVVFAVVIDAHRPARVKSKSPHGILFNTTQIGGDVGAKIRIGQHVLVSASPVSCRSAVGDGWLRRVGVVGTSPGTAGAWTCLRTVHAAQRLDGASTEDGFEVASSSAPYSIVMLAELGWAADGARGMQQQHRAGQDCDYHHRSFVVEFPRQPLVHWDPGEPLNPAFVRFFFNHLES